MPMMRPRQRRGLRQSHRPRRQSSPTTSASLPTTTVISPTTSVTSSTTDESPFLLILILVRTLTIRDFDLFIFVCTMPLCRSTHPPCYGMCYSTVVSSCCVFWSCLVLIAGSWCCCLCADPSSRLMDRTSFRRYDRGIRLAMTVMPSVTRPLAF